MHERGGGTDDHLIHFDAISPQVTGDGENRFLARVEQSHAFLAVPRAVGMAFMGKNAAQPQARGLTYHDSQFKGGFGGEDPGALLAARDLDYQVKRLFCASENAGEARPAAETCFKYYFLRLPTVSSFSALSPSYSFLR